MERGDLGETWHARALAALGAVGQSPEIGAAARLSYRGLKAGGVMHVFGSGHSSAGAMELFHRAGGLCPVNGILLPALSPFSAPPLAAAFERASGIGSTLVEQYEVKKGEALIVFSVSGVNPLPIEVALAGKEKGAAVIAVTSRASTAPSRHPSGKKLVDVAELVIDNAVPAGDAAVEYQGTRRCAALSGLTHAYIAGRLVAEIVALYQKDQSEPPVFLSANVPGGDEHNRALEARYRERIKGLKA